MMVVIDQFMYENMAVIVPVVDCEIRSGISLRKPKLDINAMSNENKTRP